MARKKLCPNPINPVHITARCPNREPFPIPLPEAWAIMEDFLYLVNKLYSLRIHSFVLMPNHFHMIASSPDVHFGKIMKDLMFHSSIAMNRQSQKINQRWGSRHFRCELKSYNYYLNAYKYVYQNPVRAGLVTRCEDWPYSTLSGLVGKSRLIIPVEHDTILFPEQFDWNSLSWLNSPIKSDHLETIRASLKKTVFNLPLSRSTRKPSYLESGLI